MGAGEPIATLRVSCANAGFDFHRTAGGDLLLGLDNVVWTLRPARAAQTPAEIVQELLIAHFTHDMGFTPESVALKNELLSADLRQRIARYFRAPQPPDEVPAIDGDPFTDSQEYPDRFTLGPVRTESARTVVPVNFPIMQRRVDYVLVTEGGRWVLDDLVDERGGSFRGACRFLKAIPCRARSRARRRRAASRSGQEVTVIRHARLGKCTQDSQSGQ